MRVVVVSQYYPPEGAAAFYPASVARELAARGHDVRVITGYPNYPGGRLFAGFHQRWRSFELDEDNLEVMRVPLYIDHSPSGFRRMLNYLSFGLSAAGARRWLIEADIIYVYATQMTPAIGPWLRRMLGGVPYVLHVQDLWPDSITGSSMAGSDRMKRIIDRLLTPWLRSVYHHADAVIGIAPTMVQTLVSRGVAPNKVHLVYNWSPDVADREEIRHNASASNAGHTRLLYAGNVGNMQDLGTLVRAVARLGPIGVELRVLGDGVALDSLQSIVERERISNVIFEGRVPMDEMERFYSWADYSVVTLRDLAAFRGTIPSKFQASIAHGVPIITNVQGDLRTLVEGAGLGFTSDAEDVEALACAIERAVNATPDQHSSMSAAARCLHKQEFSVSASVRTIEALLMDAVGASRISNIDTVLEEAS